MGALRERAERVLVPRAGAEEELLPTAERLEIGVLPYFPLASGLLTGKYRRGRPAPAGTAARARPERLTDDAFDTIEALESFAESRGVSLLDVAIGGLAAQPAIGSVIAGATKPEQVRANAAAGDWVPMDGDLQRRAERRAVPRVAFVGAGSVTFTKTLVSDLLAYPELHGELDLALHDIDPRRLEVAEAIVRSVDATRGATVRATLDRREALDGADYVLFMVQVGGHEATLLDFEIPKRHGIRATIGDTLGVGGVFRGLRTFPVICDTAREMTELRRVAAQLHEPDGDALLGRVRGHGARARRRALPLGAGNRGPARGDPRRRRARLRGGGREPPRVLPPGSGTGTAQT